MNTRVWGRCVKLLCWKDGLETKYGPVRRAPRVDMRIIRHYTIKTYPKQKFAYLRKNIYFRSLICKANVYAQFERFISVNIHGLMVSGLNLLGKHYKAPAEIWEELNNKRACFAHTGNFTTKFFPRKEALVITHSRCVACPVQVGVSRKNNTFYAGREEG